ncbi:MAG: hypothetical protein ABGY15_01530, partial [bacterium]
HFFCHFFCHLHGGSDDSNRSPSAILELSIRVVPTHRLESRKAGSMRRTEALAVGSGCRSTSIR